MSFLDKRGSGSSNEWKERHDTERRRREEAERLLEDKAMELYQANNRLQEQMEEVRALLEQLQAAHTQLADRNNDLLDSLHYASRIQQALLPADGAVKEAFPQSFVIFSPRDILSGDFYWVRNGLTHTLLVCADCTGHGVPGGLMSIMGMNLLRFHAEDPQAWAPAELMRRLDTDLMAQLAPKADTKHRVLDGMDATFLMHDTAQRQIHLAMAGHRAVLIRAGQAGMLEVQGGRFSLGGRDDTPRSYQAQTFTMNPGDRLYCFTDGVTDQFGGDATRKFTYKRLLHLLESTQQAPLAEQESLLRQELTAWQKEQPQTDDMLLIGLEF